VDRAIRHAITQGLPPLLAIQMATINPAEHFGVARDIGMIAPGRFADIVLVRNLAQFDVQMVISKGKIAAENGQLVIDLPAYTYPDWATHSIHIPHPLSAADFKLAAGDPGKAVASVVANVIGVIENQAPTRLLKIELPVTDGEVRADMAQNIAKVALIERHQGTGRVQVGLVQGFGFELPCAIASTVAHDCHHMIVVGTNDADMAQAANELAQTGGGQVVVRQGEMIGQVNLPIAGLMSSERAEVVARKAATVLYGFRACGCRMNNPNMQLSLLALVVIPELRISDLGLVDVNQFKFIPILEVEG
jgi:adenine deaminase